MLDKYLDKLYFDKRMIHWGLSQGTISQKDVQKYLSELEDVSDKAEIIQASLKSKRREKTS